MSYHIVIPARYASSRLPGKPLVDILGKTMIQRVYEQALKADALSVTVATDDERIIEACEAFGAPVVLTRNDHESGTDRLQEVAQILGWHADDVVVNVQGDEPLIPPSVINQVAHNCISNPKVSVATLCEPIHQYGDFVNPNVVKVVRAADDTALYFSRAPIPWPRDDAQQLPSMGAFRHIGIYAYRVGVLNDFVVWNSAALENTEKLEQLRFMVGGKVIHCAESCELVPGGIDTIEDLKRVRELMGEH
jgi:3-deoxy-manno-octulosonate cytidylyltransferase (CMP-KDO synthetase)